MEFYAEVRRCVYVEGLRRACGGATRRTGPRDGAQEAALPPAARVSPDAADPVSETGRCHGDPRSDPARRSASPEEATAHGHAHLRTVTGGARVQGRLHDHQRLRAREAAGRAGDVRAARAPAGRRPGRLRRGARGRRRGRTQGPLPGRGSAAPCRRVREGVSGRDDGGVLRGAQRGVP